jgi:putative thiamine transport system ATP-binding protein
VSGAALRLHAVRIALPAREVIAPLTLEIAPGECVTVMGPSGAGKSTLLAFIAGTLDPAFAATGCVTLGARDVTDLPPEARRIGILFQDDLLFPHLSVRDNLLFALPAGVRAARVATAESALAEAGLRGFGERLPASLSGGQRSRVSLLRALLAAPRALLLDEPFSKLDAALRAQMREFTFATLREHGVPTVLVTHDAADVPPDAQVIHLSEA